MIFLAILIYLALVAVMLTVTSKGSIVTWARSVPAWNIAAYVLLFVALIVAVNQDNRITRITHEVQVLQASPQTPGTAFGSAGPPGRAGKSGTAGRVGKTGQPGKNGTVVIERRVLLQPRIIVKRGPAGPKGAKGDKGDRGRQGFPGANGQTPTPGEVQQIVNQYLQQTLPPQVRQLVCSVVPMLCKSR